MQSKNEAPLTSLHIPQHKALVHAANRIILAKLKLRGDEVEVEAEDWTIRTTAKWFKPDRLKPLCSGLEKEYRIESVTVYRDRLTLQVIECLEEPSAESELILVPKTTEETRLMLALYLAKVFDCLARIELYWRPNPTTSQGEFEVLREDIDGRITLANIPNIELSKLLRTEPVEAEDSVTTSAQPAEPPKPPVSDGTTTRTKAETKVVSEKAIAAIVSKLEHKGLLKNGKASTTKWGLMDCANYIAVLSSVTENGALIQKYVDYFYREYRLPSRDEIKEYLLGNTPADWIRTAREWLK